ncbi:MAG: hypothetical protein RJA22_915 [Verrucomicrobiota bacterium]
MTGLTEPSSSAAEARFERVRQRAGFALAPLLFLALWFWPLPGLAEPAHRLLAVMAAVVTLWMTESLPLPVTALLGPVLCLLCGAFPEDAGPEPMRRVLRSFADPIIFLLLGSFLLAEAMERHGLNRRIAFALLGLPGVGRSPGRLLAAFGAVTGFISMWMSNTATTAMMFPIALAILGEIGRRQPGPGGHPGAPAFATALLLTTAFAASLGGLATPVGTPSNLIGLGFIRNQLQMDISFLQWMSFGTPLAAVLIGLFALQMRRANHGPSLPHGPAGFDWLQAERARLGRLGPGERNVLLVFVGTVTLWVLPGLLDLAAGGPTPPTAWMKVHLPEPIIGLLGGLALFLLPVHLGRAEFTLHWKDAARIDWGTILLFGGGLALSDLMFGTGLARWLGESLSGALQANNTLGLVALFTAVAILLSETTSNVAAAGMAVPVAIAVSQAAGVDPLPPALGACLGASMGFMLPVSTPPNAIVYGSGRIPLLHMARHGAWLDVIGFLLIVPTATWIIPRLLAR